MRIDLENKSRIAVTTSFLSWHKKNALEKR
jgi:hypothetical protein